MQSKHLALLVTLLVCMQTNAQTDSLINCCSTCPSDTAKAKACIQLCYDLAYDNTDSAIMFGLRGKALAEKSGNKFLVMRSYEHLAQCFEEKNRHAESMQYFGVALAMAKNLKDSIWIGKVLNNQGLAYYGRRQLDSALYFLIAGLDIRRKTGVLKEIGQSYNNIGLVYRMKGDYDNALAVYSQSLAIKQQQGDKQGILNAYINIGSAFKNKKMYDSAIYYFSKSEELAAEIGKVADYLSSQTNLGVSYNSLLEYDKALVYFNKVLSNEAYKKDRLNTLILLVGLAEANLGKKNYEKCIDYAAEGCALAEAYNKPDILFYLHQLQSECFEELGNTAMALKHYKLYKQFSDTMANRSNARLADELAAKYEAKEKEQQIALLNTSNKLKDVEISAKKNQVLLFLISAIVLSMLLLFALYQYRMKNRLNKELHRKNSIISRSLTEKETLLKEIHHRVKNNLQVVSSLLNLQSRNIQDASALAAINEGRNRVKSMAIIHQNLYRDDNLTGVDVKDYVEKLVESLFASYNIHDERILLNMDVDALQLDIDTIIPLGLILNELISNALKYAFNDSSKKGELIVKLKQTNTGLLLQVKDNGKGLPEGWKIEELQSLGYQLVRNFGQKMKAELSVDGSGGTSVSMHIKKYKLAAQGLYE